MIVRSQKETVRLPWDSQPHSSGQALRFEGKYNYIHWEAIDVSVECKKSGRNRGKNLANSIVQRR